MKKAKNKKTATFKKRLKQFSNEGILFSRKKIIEQARERKNLKLGYSFNYNNAINNKTRIVIVGTYTPSIGRENGYFYTSRSNHMYEYIDYYFKTNLVDLKNRLNADKNNKKIIDEIIMTLKRKGIAFLDVIDVGASEDTSASDDDIELFSLDKKAFTKLDLNKVVFICNSRNAECALKKYIFADKKPDIDYRVDYEPQINYHTKKEEKIKCWSERFEEIEKNVTGNEL